MVQLNIETRAQIAAQKIVSRLQSAHPRINNNAPAAFNAFSHLMERCAQLPNGSAYCDDNGNLVLVRHQPQRIIEHDLDKYEIPYVVRSRNLLEPDIAPFHDRKGWATITINPSQIDAEKLKKIIIAVVGNNKTTYDFIEQLLQDGSISR